MSLSDAAQFECPYCMTINDLEVDMANDIGQQQIVDCQICCAPIEITIFEHAEGLEIIAQRDDD